MPQTVALLSVLAAATGCADVDFGSDERAGREREGRVTRIVDGDTIVVGDEKVRLIGVDTPETRRPGTPVQCFGRKATAFTTRFIAGRQVRLELDVEERDRYGRLLAYVVRTADDASLNAALVRRGYAMPLTVPPNVRHAGEYARLARRAREEGRGLWSACR